MHDTSAERTDESRHVPVLLAETLAGLNIKPGGLYVDCTFGRGGHTRAILEQLNSFGRVIALDRDKDAVDAGQLIVANDQRLRIVHAAFSDLQTVLRGLPGEPVKVDGVLLDLGVSSPQLDTAERGFSFMRDGPLDMRMNRDAKLTARDWIASARTEDLAKVFFEFGEERFARRIANAIVNYRGQQAIVTTGQLADIVKAAHPAWEQGVHPATRVFQALRILINRELDELRAVLPQAVQILAGGGRLAVISFHSLEDRIVKRFLRKETSGDEFPPGLPVSNSSLTPRLCKLGKAIKPTIQEINRNPRCRSAVLRIAERLG